ncbi:hypothetical protein PR048_021132 [Dryococelus australis]|uniref:Ankyrin repeat domain-containing protein n=1 Tax=Dryococelus australis TaxID=614101 RepID=A0ABQ9GXD9_9NEOP|nr:hypothetical protein PR048_021132 [Dryococelus australis]
MCGAGTLCGCYSLGIWFQVEEFVRNRDWRQLKPKLLPLLDDSSVVYDQVRHIDVLPMYIIGQHNYNELASLLLCAGMPVDALDNRSHTMLHGAAGGGELQLTKMLLDLGAYVNVKNSKGYTPIMKAAYYNHLEVVKVLLQAGADTRAKNNERLTALDLARKNRAREVEEYLGQFPH